MWLQEWSTQKDKEKQNIKLTNQQEAEARQSQQDKKKDNPWDRVFDNVEIN